jgi:hypothetical protein
MSNIQLWLLLAIVVLAAVLRIWGIGQYPVGLNADEAAIGYCPIPQIRRTAARTIMKLNIKVL